MDKSASEQKIYSSVLSLIIFILLEKPGYIFHGSYGREEGGQPKHLFAFNFLKFSTDNYV